ncbi:DMT family transporter [Marinactinospora thermotolerans]|uniref:Quaternary ammonium compound-resistance protein SugE n=1 Tax=Marinactinospora thermotolerans DSM 45154 TaxID=1122192 RepID=A0A1T4T5Z0_9ACTN|nr:SMR family transporter [Marinactinospora thermotolerans]SKA35807.1 quaternary ammonium compound-resistance protein SugE [Marinactinospora thermotolerans DSM 45154]
MAWVLLVASGLMEAVWASAIGASQGFRKKGPTVLFVVALVLSMVGLAYAMTAIPTGTAYAVWVGIGAVLTVLYPVARGKEQLTLGRGGLLLVLIGCIIGLKVVG